MRALALALALAALPAVAAGAAPAPRVDVMVVGKARVLGGPRTVAASATLVTVGRRRCAVGVGTPLAALAALHGPSFALRDFGACSRRAADAESLYVSRIGPDRAAGPSGWVYKVGRRAPSLGAGSLRLRSGARVLWFYCRQGRGGCQRTLEVTASAARLAPGGPVTFTVRGYDDRGRGVAVAGARVRFAGAELRTGADGRAATTAPVTPGRRRATADAPGLATGFPVVVTVA